MGFKKILNKYDKWAQSNIKAAYIGKLEAEDFYSQVKLNELVSTVEKELYELERLQIASPRMQPLVRSKLVKS
jgi:SPX domain protein involved in polyphosphate accumulation